MTDTTMTTVAHLWAISYDNLERAFQVREEIVQLGWGNGEGGKSLNVPRSSAPALRP